MPALTPVTMPPAIPAAGELLLHIPPVALLPKEVMAPAHTTGLPVIVPAWGNGFTVTIMVSVAVPQLLVVLYEMMALPALTPVTVPPAIVAFGEPELHMPAAARLANVVIAPSQTIGSPVIVPA